MRKLQAVLTVLIVCAFVVEAHAQVVPSATRNRMSITVGGFGSAFNPDYQGGGITGTSSNELFGVGAFVDVHLSRWVQAEAEGRWLRFNQFAEIYQDNYLIGPRVPIHDFGRITPYAKVLIGMGHMNFEYGATSCRCTAIVYGGGVDYKLSPRLSWRAVDFEYQQWPDWYVLQNAQLHPYGFSTGVGFRIF